MTTFDSLIKAIYAERLNDLNKDPSRLKWFWNHSSLRENTFSAQTRVVRSDGTATEIGTIMYHYADQNPNGKSLEARLVKRGAYKRHQVGWLWSHLNGSMVWLAKITPKGATSLNKGWIDKGIMYLNLKKQGSRLRFDSASGIKCSPRLERNL